MVCKPKKYARFLIRLVTNHKSVSLFTLEPAFILAVKAAKGEHKNDFAFLS